jgi:hypothetical protein
MLQATRGTTINIVLLTLRYGDRTHICNQLVINIITSPTECVYTKQRDAMKAWLGHLLFLDQRRIALTQSWVYNHVTHSTLHSHHSGKLPGRMPTQPVLGRRHHTLWLSDWKSLPLASGCWSATSAATVSQHHNIGRPHWSASVLCRSQPVDSDQRIAIKASIGS